MKKLFFIIAMCFTALTIQAQRCAVLDFQVGTGVTEEDIEGISYEFRSKFNPRGYQMLERPIINRTITNFGYDKTDMTQQQILKVGRNLDAQIVVVGTMNKFMDEYSVEIRAIDVSSGRTVASEGANFERTAYRANMQKAAQSLANKLSSRNTGSTASGSSSANVPQGYVDLGLPSGTLWKTFNATGFYSYEEAVTQFGTRLPTKEQWEELKGECQWQWTGSGYKVTGNNGNSMTLPAAGIRNCDGSVRGVGSLGFYCSSTPSGSEEAWELFFNSGRVEIGRDSRCNGLSVRLVQD
jgi:hypothetical protein